MKRKKICNLKIANLFFTREKSKWRYKGKIHKINIVNNNRNIMLHQYYKYIKNTIFYNKVLNKCKKFVIIYINM